MKKRNAYKTVSFIIFFVLLIVLVLCEVHLNTLVLRYEEIYDSYNEAGALHTVKVLKYIMVLCWAFCVATYELCMYVVQIFLHYDSAHRKQNIVMLAVESLYCAAMLFLFYSMIGNVDLQLWGQVGCVVFVVTLIGFDLFVKYKNKN